MYEAFGCESHGEKLESENAEWRAVGCGGKFRGGIYAIMRIDNVISYDFTRSETVRCKP